MLFYDEEVIVLFHYSKFLDRREPIEQIWREKLTVTTKESANSLKQPFCLLSFQLEVKLSPSPELDFLTYIYNNPSQLRLGVLLDQGSLVSYNIYKTLPYK